MLGRGLKGEAADKSKKEKRGGGAASRRETGEENSLTAEQWGEN